MEPRIEFSEEKNLLLKAIRGVCFEDVIEAIEKDRILDDLEHKNKKKYPNQKILVIKIKSYVYSAPYIINKKKGVIFLKTIYPSRTLTNKYLKK